MSTQRGGKSALGKETKLLGVLVFIASLHTVVRRAGRRIRADGILSKVQPQ